MLERSYDLPVGYQGQYAYTFMICILYTPLTSVSSFSVCCCSRFVSLWIQQFKHLKLQEQGSICIQLRW
jgi:hypothetical protein